MNLEIKVGNIFTSDTFMRIFLPKGMGKDGSVGC